MWGGGGGAESVECGGVLTVATVHGVLGQM